jgi:predicted secreted hydrolase
VDAQGRSSHLHVQEFTLQRLDGTWKSPVTSAVYPVHWKISIPKLGITLEVTTRLDSQEMTGSTKLAPNYWEGAIQLSGNRNGAVLHGVGYLEMTGYDRPIALGQ